MTRKAVRDWLIAACYGLWAGICALAAFSAFVAIVNGFPRSDRSPPGDLIDFLPFAAVAMISATLGWIMLHRRSRPPGPGACIALAISVVVIVHLALTLSMRGPPEAFFPGTIILFLVHFWLTIPVAIGATGLFVVCLRPLKAA